MNFEVNLGHKDQYFLRTAGLEIPDYFDTWEKAILGKKLSLPVELPGIFFLSERPVKVVVTVLSFRPDARVKIEVDDAVVGKKILEHLNHYSPENRGSLLDDTEHKEVWTAIEEILGRDGLSYKAWQHGAVLPRHTMESLIELCEKTVWFRKDNIYGLFTNHAVAKADHAFAARWLIQLFKAERDHFEQIGVRIWELAVPQIADDLIVLIQDPRYGERRGVLCLALAKTKHLRAAEVLASVLHEEGVTRWALEALGKLKASQHVESVCAFLHHSNADIRREAKKTLKKLGFPVEIPPPPVHLVKNRRLLTEGLEEWSTNLDIEDLNPTLEALAKCVESGFSKQEIAEINGVVDEMKHNQTKTFCFPISVRGQNSEAWVELFMDDIDSPDLAIYARAELIQKMSGLLPERE